MLRLQPEYKCTICKTAFSVSIRGNIKKPIDSYDESHPILLLYNLEGSPISKTCCGIDCAEESINQVIEKGELPRCQSCKGPVFDGLEYASRAAIMDFNNHGSYLFMSIFNVGCSSECKENLEQYHLKLFEGPPCAVCKKPGCSKKCARCDDRFYCSPVCQKRDWKNHKPNCKITQS